MAKYELPIYGVDDEIITTYTTNHVTWAVYIKAAEIEPELQDKPPAEMFKIVGEILKEVFEGLTDEHLLKADGSDVLNTFAQVVSGGQQIKQPAKGNSKKNL